MAKAFEQDVITEGNLFISPIEFFCGDNVTLSFDFVVSEGTALDLETSPNLNFLTNDEISSVISIDPEVFSVNNIRLTADKNNVNIKMECVFWKPENIKLPSIKIKLKNEMLVINVPEFKVSSILEKTHSTSIRPYKEPEIIPGSGYIVVGEVILLLGVLALIITAFIKIKKIKAFFAKIKQRKIYKKNFRKTLFKIKLLSKTSSNYTDAEYCSQLQNILRSYLAVRFSDSVYNLTTSEIINWFEDVFGRLHPDVAEKVISLFYEVMYRCDFIRFSGNSIPDELMQTDERETLLKNTLQVIEYFEKGLIEC